jgi:hypothetical protein
MGKMVSFDGKIVSFGYLLAKFGLSVELESKQ